GIERDAAAVASARELGGGPEFLQLDVRDFQPEPESLDLIIAMSQSFGIFWAVENQACLEQFARSVRLGGRIILDLWNPDFFANHQGTREFALETGTVVEKKWVKDQRLFVRLEYPDGSGEAFDWQLWTARQMASLGQICGLSLRVACSNFDADFPPIRESPRIHFILEKSEA
ncbi:MAG: class I SAM-dependent methyltransferase, partial [Chthoniobacteraceae bacterium]